MRLRDATPHDIAAMKSDLDIGRVAAAIVMEDGSGGIVLVRDPFDSELFSRPIAKIVVSKAASTYAYGELLSALRRRAAEAGIAQILRRVPVSGLAEIWALEGAGFEMMDVGVTFARRIDSRIEPRSWDDLEIRIATDTDMNVIVPSMIERPWGSRYEADPGYTAEQVRELRSRWLWNSHRGRAQAVFVGALGEEPAGYVTCLLDDRTSVGEIDLVGTLPQYRGRRVASRVLDHAFAWFSTRARLVTVRTQATNFAAAALYEKAGFTLFASDMTFRLELQRRESVP